MADKETGLVADEPASPPTLDSIIDKAYADSEARETAQPEDDTRTPSERAHDDKGRFAPKDSTTEASPKENAEAAPAEATQAKVEPAPAQPIDPPARWTEVDKAKFASWPRDVQEAVAERYKAIEADYTRKTQEAADIRRSAEPLLQSIEPFRQYLTSLGPVIGRAPHELIRDLLGVEYKLRTGSPQEKYQALAQISQSYGIDLAALARGEVVQPNPELQQLRQELAAVNQWRTQFEQNIQQQQTEQAVLQIDAFAAAKDDAGRPRYPHFTRVRGVMQHALMNGEANTLEEAYQKATEPINAAIAEELSRRNIQADTQRKDAVSKAEKAAPVRSSGSQPGGSAKGKDLDSILSDAMAKAGMG